MTNESKKKRTEKEKQIEFIKNRGKKSMAIAIILFVMVIIFFLTTIIRISSNIS